MSDSFEAVVDVEVTPDAAGEIASRVLGRLIAEEIVLPDLDSEAVLGGEGGYRPGLKIPKLYRLQANECEFWTLETNGLEIEAKPWFNVFGTTCLEGVWCPKCEAKFDLTDDLLADPFAKAVGEFYEGNAKPTVECPKCGTLHSVRDWKAQPHLGFANLAFVFWNWPRLNSSYWELDIPKLIANVSGHNIVTTYGRV